MIRFFVSLENILGSLVGLFFFVLFGNCKFAESSKKYRRYNDEHKNAIKKGNKFFMAKLFDALCSAAPYGCNVYLFVFF